MDPLLLNRRQYLELEKIGVGAFAPLRGFMDAREFRSVVDELHLPGGEPFPLPVVLDVSPEDATRVRRANRVALAYGGAVVGEMEPLDVFQVDRATAAEQLFGMTSTAHPGVAHFFRMAPWFVGGTVRLVQRVHFEFSAYELSPQETQRLFAERGWRTVVGFQTRNVPHRAHEHLHRLGLEIADGLFIQPLVGARKRGDFTPEAILAGYRVLIEQFYPAERVVLGILSTYMRYAGPREAIFHAIIRRNYGCTHFIVGRDHGGVGGLYGKYDAHELARRFDGRLGIEILPMAGPFHCGRCGGTATERTCGHRRTAPEVVREINASDVRRMLAEGVAPPPELMRSEVLAGLAGIPLFIEEDAE